MKLFLVKPDLIYYDRYNEMMEEWCSSNTKIAPWFLDKPVGSLKAFADFVQKLDEFEHANQDKKFCSTTSYFVVSENDDLIGAASLRHYLTIEGLNTWGHSGYGVRPNERKKGYGTEILKLVLEGAKKKKIYKVLISAHKSNVASCRIIEKCNGIFESEVNDPDNINEKINRYWIENK